MLKRNLIFAIAMVLIASPVMACLWDYDTLRDEKRGMPGIAEVLAGQWERHSQFFYHNRVEKMKALLATKPDDQDAMDNLAVAYHKLGQTDAGIAVMLDKEKRFPGQYTTYSNLGTFYMLKGDLDDGIVYIKKALAINPNAHFGREEYQLNLAEYLRASGTNPSLRDHSFICYMVCADSPTTAPTTNPSDAAIEMNLEYSGFELDRSAGRPSRLEGYRLKPNVFDGVTGMLRFGTDQSPDLYYALGDLLAVRGDKNLAVRAYQRALDLNYCRPEAIKQALTTTEEMQVPRGGLNPAVIVAERADAAKWVAEYQQFEDDLVRTGKDTDDEASYAPFYATHGRTLKTNDAFAGDYFNQGFYSRHEILTPVGILTIAAFGGIGVLRLLRRFIPMHHNAP